jgi:hypothetical protein
MRPAHPTNHRSFLVQQEVEAKQHCGYDDPTRQFGPGPNHGEKCNSAFLEATSKFVQILTVGYPRPFSCRFFSAGQPEPMAGRFFVGNTNAAQKDRPLVGFLDDLRFYPRALSTQEIEEIRLGVGP